MRILVCGGRDFCDKGFVFAALDHLHAARGVTCIIHGAARGADALAAEWASSRNIPAHEYPADWKTLGRRAGPVRNQQMLDEGRPDGVVAFPGGRGTADMIQRSQSAGLKVWVPSSSVNHA